MSMRWVIGLQGCLKNRKVSLWKHICNGWGSFISFVMFEVGTGNHVYFFGGIYGVGRWYFWKPFHLYFV